MAPPPGAADAPPAPTSASSAEGVLATCAAHGLTAAEFGRLRERASAAKASAYCPYSGFRVGAAVLWPRSSDAAAADDDDGGGDDAAAAAAAATTTVTAGANVENASYPVGTCAERVALARAVVEGGRAFRAIAVATDVSPPASPCGMCRQFIREFCRRDVPIIMFDKNLDYVVLTLDQLLPMSFGPEDLQPHVGARGSV